MPVRPASFALDERTNRSCNTHGTTAFGLRISSRILIASFTIRNARTSRNMRIMRSAFVSPPREVSALLNINKSRATTTKSITPNGSAKNVTMFPTAIMRTVSSVAKIVNVTYSNIDWNAEWTLQSY